MPSLGGLKVRGGDKSKEVVGGGHEFEAADEDSAGSVMHRNEEDGKGSSSD
jgi:hypothetical protein